MSQKLKDYESLAEANFNKSKSDKIRAGVRWMIKPEGSGVERHETFQFSTVEDVKEFVKQLINEPTMLMVEVVTYQESYKHMTILSRWARPSEDLKVEITEYPASHPDKLNNDSTRFNKWLGEADLPLSFKAFFGEKENTDVVWMRFHENYAGRLSRPTHHEFENKEDAIAFLQYKTHR